MTIMGQVIEREGWVSEKEYEPLKVVIDTTSIFCIQCLCSSCDHKGWIRGYIDKDVLESQDWCNGCAYCINYSSVGNKCESYKRKE